VEERAMVSAIEEAHACFPQDAVSSTFCSVVGKKKKKQKARFFRQTSRCWRALLCRH